LTVAVLVVFLVLVLTLATLLLGLATLLSLSRLATVLALSVLTTLLPLPDLVTLPLFFHIIRHKDFPPERARTSPCSRDFRYQRLSCREIPQGWEASLMTHGGAEIG
jgi:hypothetical protein